MLHIVAPLRSTFCSYRKIIPPWLIFRGHISTNSAIHHGIRRSSWRGGAARSNDRDEGRRGQGSPRSESRKEPRFPRPNHSHRQDVDDMAESARLRDAKRSPEQKHYLQGGRKPTEWGERKLRANAGDGVYGSSPRPSSRSARRPGDSPSRYQTARSAPSTDAAQHAPAFRYQKDILDRYDRSRSKASQDSRSSSQIQGRGPLGPPNRAARRALIFEQSEGSMDRHRNDGAASSIARSDKTEWRRSDSRLFVGVEERGLSSRFTPRSRSEDFRGRDRATDVPVSVPYTTPASEFLYGTSVVSAALKSSRRKFYKFYSYSAPDRANYGQDQAMRNLARSKGVEVIQVEGEWSRLLDKMSTGRPHNGYVLEASPLPKIPVVSLEPMTKPQDIFHAYLDHQSREEEAINGTKSLIRSTSNDGRYPLVLFLDGIVDPGNLGALLRTAYFFGVDAVAYSLRNCAPFSPVTLKASVGASESIRLLSVNHPQKFVEESQRNGWKFYAAVAPTDSSKENRNGQPYFSTSSLMCPTRSHPSVLMLGGEGEGLRWNLQKKADYLVGIEGQKLGQGGVDSLNVSVAAGILCEAFSKVSVARRLPIESMPSTPVQEDPSSQVSTVEERVKSPSLVNDRDLGVRRDVNLMF